MQTGSVFNCDRADIDAGSVPGECPITPGKPPKIHEEDTAALIGKRVPGAMDRIGLADAGLSWRNLPFWKQHFNDAQVSSAAVRTDIRQWR